MKYIGKLELGEKKILEKNGNYEEVTINKYQVPLILNAYGLQQAREMGIISSASLRELQSGDFGDDGFTLKVLYIGYLGGTNEKDKVLSLKEFSHKITLDPIDFMEQAHHLIFPELIEEYEKMIKEIEEKNKQAMKALKIKISEEDKKK